MSIYSILLAILIGINILFGITIVFLERRSVSSTWAWLMILNFLPIIGFIFYLIFGQNLSRRKIFKWDHIVHKRTQDLVSKQMLGIVNQDPPFSEPILREYHRLIYLNLNNDEAPLTLNNKLSIFTDGETKFQNLLHDIRCAKHHIHIEYYIFRGDFLGNQLIDLLTKKAEEGVIVRLLVDDEGSRRLPKKLVRRLTQAGGKFYTFFPGRLPLLNLRINYRNHRKLVIIDSKISYIGGFNVGDEYLGLSKKFGFWRDTHLRIVGEAVNSIQSRFLLDWHQASKERVPFQSYYTMDDHTKYGEVGIQIVSSGPDQKWEQIKNAFIKMILSAKQTVYIQTPYLIPDESLLNAISIASLSHVDVRIMIPNKPDHPFVYWATYSNVGALLDAGARVYLYQNGFLHAKTIIVDERLSTVGTSNLDFRSFGLNFEVNAFIYHQETSQQLATIFKKDIRLSRELTPSDYQNRPFIIKFKESISRLISPVL
ncbi:cardiolipin synthase [Sporolactobacillus terrae]|uniref:Cardiolipin synthase n=1 Tax=Sporolactobacillus terrae TaxID=269673 RepID=A0ABX5Q5W8_9BACL|nr:cardiolipin synthase [Sporolactobacillus terrae]QAA22045.1 cardiolipin synthase [Sporolactobacillus terrae]QAA25018.1 cardiolipin synthase [Sporolactobacillus terrae]UAK16841.1 cardiolipin synthase [Sporolactobacillus terrae]